MRRRINSYTNDPAELFFENNGLFRKSIPRDGSCLFRAFAEQLCCSQFDHHELRSLCLDFMSLYKAYFQKFTNIHIEVYIDKMRNPSEVGGELEMLALSIMYQVDVILFPEIGSPPRNITNFAFPKKIMLYLNDGHFDLVYKNHYPAIAGFCEALVYEAFYKDIFKMTNVLNVVDGMLHDGTLAYKSDLNTSSDITDLVEQMMDPSKTPNSAVQNSSFDASSSPEKGKSPPFPYRVAKAIDKTIYRNIEYDTWRALRREEKYGPYNANGLQNGCKVTINCSETFSKDTLKSLKITSDILHGYIQFMSKDQGPVEVFVEEFGRRMSIPYKALEKVVSSASVPSFSAVGSPAYKVSSSQTYRAEKGMDSLPTRMRTLSISSSINNFIGIQDSNESSIHSESFSPRKDPCFPEDEGSFPFLQDQFYEQPPHPTASAPIEIPDANKMAEPQCLPFYYDSLTMKYSEISLTEQIYNSPFTASFPGPYYPQQTWCFIPNEQMVPSTYPYSFCGWDCCSPYMAPIYNAVPQYAPTAQCIPTEYISPVSVPGIIPLSQSMAVDVPTPAENQSQPPVEGESFPPKRLSKTSKRNPTREALRHSNHC